MKKLIFILSLFIAGRSAAEELVSITRDFGSLHGTLLQPAQGAETAALLIAGSGPTDRNGNGQNIRSNSYLYLAEALEKAGIASLRYDKRGIGASRYDNPADLREEDLRFDDFVDDAAACVDYLAAKGYRRIVLVGHSEGALIALRVAQNNPKITAIVHVAGAGYPLGDILKLQLAQQLMTVDPALMIEANGIIDRLARGQQVENVPPMLTSLFRPSVQPYMISSLVLNPCKLIATQRIPILIIQGDNDLQVTVDNAEALAKAHPRAQKTIIPGMTHTLKHSDSRDFAGQMSSVYSNADLPLDPTFAAAVIDFIRRL